ncbi:hypothetical protein Tco_1335023 [Tanacetum coccineum]
MSITKEQQQALDDALLLREQRLRIGNYPSFEEEILAFIQELGYSGNIKSLYDVKYGAILPDTLTNQAMEETNAYKTYYDLATGKFSDDKDDDEVSESKDDEDNSDDENDDDQDDDKETHEEKLDEEEECSDQRVHTPSPYESTNDEVYYEITQDARQGNVEATQVIEGMDSIINLNFESTSLVDVPVTTDPEIPPSSATTLPPPPIPLIQHLQQTTISTPTISPRIVDNYLASKLKDTVDAAIQLQSDRLSEEAQADNQEFLNKIDKNMQKVIKEQVKVQVEEHVSKILPRIEKSVNEQLEVEVMIHSSNEAKISHANLYKALFDAYEADKDILETYGDTVTFKRSQDDQDEDEEPFAGSNWGSKRRRARKEPESTSVPKDKTSKLTGSSKERSKCKTRSTGKSAQVEEPIHIVKDLEELVPQSSK